MTEKGGYEGVLLGTPISSAESALLSRKQPRTTRAPRVWEQIATDEQGRRRLHGAFTGGFSAGYFNTVATKEGFVPKSFRTSRSQRAEERTQAVQDFYDKDELEEQEKVDVATQDVYDTFASSRNEKARERAEREARDRPIIPGEIISEFIEGVSESIGVQLLQKMGWRQGKGIGEAFRHELVSGWGPDASISQECSHVWNEKPKMNVQGLGFDPFRGSRAFERHKAKRTTEKPSTKRSRGIAFGVGVLEETDTFGEIGDYVEGPHDRMNYYDMSDNSDDDKAAHLTSEKGPKRLADRSSSGKESFVSGFRLGSILHDKKVFQLPIVPSHFSEKHHGATDAESADPSKPVQLTVPKPQIPADEGRKRAIDSVAVFVAKGGMMSEELARQQHMGDEAFSFLFGGEGSEYYRWKLLDVKVTFQKLGVNCIGLREAPLTADDRGFLLGDAKMKETPIASRVVSHPFIQGVPEADRSRVKSALNATFVRGSTETTLHTDESEPGLRAPKPKELKTTEDETTTKRTPQPSELTPVRSFLDWHPLPLLYKRFNVLDPLKGMPREEEQKSKFMSYESALDEVKTEEAAPLHDLPTTSIADEVDIMLPPPEYTEPPIDIFKSIFDASDDEDGGNSDPEEEIKKEEDIPATTAPIEPERAEAKASPVQRQRLKISSDESEGEETEKEEPSSRTERRKRRKEHERSESEEFDESVLSGLSTSEFKKLLKTLKKGRAKKKSKKSSKHKKHRKQRKEHKSTDK